MGKLKQRIKELEERVKELEKNDVIFNTIFSRKINTDTPICNITSRPVQLTKHDKEVGDKLVRHTLRNNSIHGAFDKLNEAVKQLKRAIF